MANSNPTTQIIDSIIVSLLGLQNDLELSHEDYFRALREASFAARLSGSKFSSEEISLITEELKRIKKEDKNIKFYTEKKKVKAKTKAKTQKVPKKKSTTTPKPPKANTKVTSLSTFVQPPTKNRVVREPKSLAGTTEVSPKVPLLPAPKKKTVEVKEKKQKIKKENCCDVLGKKLTTIDSTLGSILSTLKEQFALRKKDSERERRGREKSGREDTENKLEKGSGIKEIVGVAKGLLSPFQDIFDRIKRFIVFTLLGKAFTMFMDWMKDPKNRQTFFTITKFLTDHWVLIVGSYLLFGTKLGGLVRSISKLVIKLAVKSVVATGRLIAVLAKSKWGRVALAGAAVAGTAVAVSQAGKKKDENVEKYADGGIIGGIGNALKYSPLGMAFQAGKFGAKTLGKAASGVGKVASGAAGFLGKGLQKTLDVATLPLTVGFKGLSGASEFLLNGLKSLNIFKLLAGPIQSIQKKGGDKDPKLAAAGGIPGLIGLISKKTSETVGKTTKESKKSKAEIPSGEGKGYAKGGLINPLSMGLMGAMVPGAGLLGTMLSPLMQSKKIGGDHGVPVSGAGRDDRLLKVRTGDAILTEKDQKLLSSGKLLEKIGGPLGAIGSLFGNKGFGQETVVAAKKGEAVVTQEDQKNIFEKTGINIPSLLAGRKASKVSSDKLKAKSGSPLGGFFGGGIIPGYADGGVVGGNVNPTASKVGGVDPEMGHVLWRKYLDKNPNLYARGGKLSDAAEMRKAHLGFMRTYMRTGKPPEWAVSNDPPKTPKPNQQPRSSQRKPSPNKNKNNFWDDLFGKNEKGPKKKNFWNDLFKRKKSGSGSSRGGRPPSSSALATRPSSALSRTRFRPPVRNMPRVNAPAIQALFAGMEFLDRKSEGQTNAQAGLGAGGSALGGTLGWIGGAKAGAAGGAVAGAAIGAFFGGVGAVPGAAIGGAIGGIGGGLAGGWGGAKLGGSLADELSGVNAARESKNRGGVGGKVVSGWGLKDTGNFESAPNTMVMTDPKTGRPFVGYKALKDGRLTYSRGLTPGTGSTNPFERIGRFINPNAYADNDARLSLQKQRIAMVNSLERFQSQGMALDAQARMMKQLGGNLKDVQNDLNYRRATQNATPRLIQTRNVNTRGSGARNSAGGARYSSRPSGGRSTTPAQRNQQRLVNARPWWDKGGWFGGAAAERQRQVRPNRPRLNDWRGASARRNARANTRRKQGGGIVKLEGGGLVRKSIGEQIAQLRGIEFNPSGGQEDDRFDIFRNSKYYFNLEESFKNYFDTVRNTNQQTKQTPPKQTPPKPNLKNPFGTDLKLNLKPIQTNYQLPSKLKNQNITNTAFNRNVDLNPQRPKKQSIADSLKEIREMRARSLDRQGEALEAVKLRASNYNFPKFDSSKLSVDTNKAFSPNLNLNISTPAPAPTPTLAPTPAAPPPKPVGMKGGGIVKGIRDKIGGFFGGRRKRDLARSAVKKTTSRSDAIKQNTSNITGKKKRQGKGGFWSNIYDKLSTVNNVVKGAKTGFSKVKNITKGIPGITSNLVQSIRNNPKILKAGTAFGKFGGRMVPGLGVATSAADAASRTERGDKLGAALAGLGAVSGATTLATSGASLTGIGAAVPAVAEVVSMGADTALLGKDLFDIIFSEHSNKESGSLRDQVSSSKETRSILASRFGNPRGLKGGGLVKMEGGGSVRGLGGNWQALAQMHLQNSLTNALKNSPIENHETLKLMAAGFPINNPNYGLMAGQARPTPATRPTPPPPPPVFKLPPPPPLPPIPQVTATPSAPKVPFKSVMQKQAEELREMRARSMERQGRKTEAYGTRAFNTDMSSFFTKGMVMENTGINMPGGTADRQLTLLQPGEYVIPKQTVNAFGGASFFDNMVAKTDSDSNPAKLGAKNESKTGRNIKPYPINNSNRKPNIINLGSAKEARSGAQLSQGRTQNGSSKEVFFDAICQHGSAPSERQRIMDLLGVNS